eukprot:TRINITY_DN3695_c0_g1_i2.p1 TRINITY_DN3695_c0_g1~~TRINITY_DN3695_c0_g1_i2.p1  ORF type:complete len:497 (+),score=156.97 TRINITY_DN3695_c0_g1_i2:73-1491(+)
MCIRDRDKNEDSSPTKRPLNNKSDSTMSDSTDAADPLTPIINRPRSFSTGYAEAMRAEVEANFETYFAILFFIGLITTHAFTLISSSSKDVASSFKMSHVMGMFQMFSILSGIFMKTFNSAYLLKVEHRVRFKMVMGFNVTGALILVYSATIAESWGFYIALLGAVSIGLGGCLGDATMQGFLSTLPSIVVAGYASGLGLAGAYSSTYYLAMKYYQIPTYVIYGLMLPMLGIYFTLFTILDEKRTRVMKKVSVTGKPEDLVDGPESAQSKATVVGKNKNLDWASFKLAFPHIKKYLIFSLLVYISQYTSMGCFNQKYRVIDAHSGKFEETFLDKQGFVFLTLSYQIATFISRSSIRFYRINRIHLLVVAQVLNALALFTISILRVQFSIPVPIVFNFVIMFWAGLVGGGYFANAMYQLMNQKTIPKELKELSVNLCSIANDVGIFCASLSTIFFDNTILKYRTVQAYFGYDV